MTARPTLRINTPLAFRVPPSLPDAQVPRLRVLCDCDGVLSDFVGCVLEYIQRNTGMSYRREAIDQWDCFAAVGLSEHWPYFKTQCDRLDLCRRMPELPGGRELWAELTRPGAPYEVKVCTTPMTVAWLSQRAAWLEAFGVPLKHQWQGEGKEDFAGKFDVLLDDRVENCVAFRKAGGVSFCIAAAYNTHAHGLPTYVPRGTHAECVSWLRSLAGVRP